MTRLVVIALVAVGCWTLSAALAWLWVYAALRRDDDVPEPDGVQPWDIPPWDYPATVTTSGSPSVTVRLN